jgi:DNA-binding LacI/PurR family transcriptional regulator
VIGFDDCVYSHMTSPLLTTIRVPSKEMGIIAAEILLDALNTGKPGRKVTLEPEITERESVRYI